MFSLSVIAQAVLGIRNVPSNMTRSLPLRQKMSLRKPLIKQKSLKITKSRKKDFNTDLDVRLDLSNEKNPWLKNPYEP